MVNFNLSTVQAFHNRCVNLNNYIHNDFLKYKLQNSLNKMRKFFIFSIGRFFF